MPTPTPITGHTISQLATREERIFPFYPQVARYFPSAAMEDARKRLGRAIERGDGPGLVIGAPGTGKSLLLQVLAAQYHDRFDVVLLACARLCTRRALLQAILFELGLPYKLRDEGELRLSLLDHLLSVDECPMGLLLLVDEAQTLPLPLLDELRVLTNLVRGDRPRVRLVLAGSSTLEESFAHPELESFSQRLAARCYLAPLGREETTQFIRAQLAASRVAPGEIFAADAWDAIFEATDGVPRLVNQLCDRALQFGAADGRRQFDRDLIQRAWSDLQQLPAPWDTPAITATPESVSRVIEFGGLSDDASLDDGRANAAVDDIDPTELDFEEDVAELGDVNAGLPQVAPVAGRQAADPFAEQFEEEEVVIDNFAAWDDLFLHQSGMPRVENRRDPGFATLVQAAMDASSVPEHKCWDASPLGIVRQIESDDLGVDELSAQRPDPSESCTVDGKNETADCPPLRLAVVSDPAPLTPIPLLPSATQIAAEVAAAFDTMTLGAIDKGNKQTDADSPILVVEDDHSPIRPRPPVRREEYRNLFSRLRSG